MKKLKLDRPKLKLNKAIISTLSDSEMSKINAGYAAPTQTCLTQNGQATCISQGCINPTDPILCGPSSTCPISATCASNTCPTGTCPMTGCSITLCL